MKADAEHQKNVDQKPSSMRGQFVFAIGASLFLHGLAVAAIYSVRDKVFHQASEPPKMRLVVVDLVSFKKGASSNKISRAEQKSAPEAKAEISQAKQTTQQKPTLDTPKKTHDSGEKPPKPREVIREVIREVTTAPAVMNVEEQASSGEADKLPATEEPIPQQKVLRKELETVSQKTPAIVAPVLPKPVLDIDQGQPKTTARPKQKKPAKITKRRVEKKKSLAEKKAQSRKVKRVKISRSKKTAPKTMGRAKTAVRQKSKKAKKKRRVSSRGQSGRGVQKKGKSKTGRTQGASYSGAGLSNPRPRYPAEARRRRQQGRVLLRVRVSAKGRAASVRVARSSGHKVLDRAARSSVQRWRFRPAMKNGRAHAATVTVPISFRLRN